MHRGRFFCHGQRPLPRASPLVHGSRPCTKVYDCFILVRSYLVCLPADSCRQAKLIFGCRKGKGYLDDQKSKKTKRELPEFGCRENKGYLDDQTSKKIKRELPEFGCGKDKGNLDDQTSKKTERELPEFGCRKGKDYLDNQTRRKQKKFSR